jgi:mycothiol synthase
MVAPLELPRAVQRPRPQALPGALRFFRRPLGDRWVPAGPNGHVFTHRWLDACGDTRSVEDVRLRGYRRDDLPAMVGVWNLRVAAEGEGLWATTEWFAEAYDHLVRCDPATDIVVAEDGSGSVVGYARASWDDVAAGYRAYPLAFIGDDRIDGLEARLLDWAAARATAIAAEHEVPDHRLDADATDGTARQALLLERGFTPTSRWGFMVRDLTAIPECSLPDPLVTRPVLEGHLPAIWQGHVDATRDDPDFVEPTEDDWRAFLDEAGEGTDLWQVAWDGDRVAGQVRTRPAAATDDERRGRSRAWTEDISTRPEWRRRGVASALICASLRQLVGLGSRPFWAASGPVSGPEAAQIGEWTAGRPERARSGQSQSSHQSLYAGSSPRTARR